MNLRAGIIGYGRFGQLAARYLSAHIEVVVYDRKPPSALPPGVCAVPLREAASQPLVILAIPINALPKLLEQIAPIVRKDAVVFDVCSVKEEPVRWMKKALPRSVTVIGTHPLFGPDSAADSIAGRNIVVCPARDPGTLTLHLRHLLESAGLQVITMTAREHDKLMASTLFLTQFIGHGVGSKLLPKTDVTTKNFEKLREIVITSSNDSMELFRDMYRYNRYARRIPEKVLKNMRETAGSLRTRK